MTTGELIKLLQEADPSGEIPVCVDNEDVYFVDRGPAYYDGLLQQLVHDSSKLPYWTIVGAKLTSRGEKVNIRPMGILDVLVDHPDLVIECIGNYAEDRVAAWRKEAAEINEEATKVIGPRI